jgi:hypothetical protein
VGEQQVDDGGKRRLDLDPEEPLLNPSGERTRHEVRPGDGLDLWRKRIRTRGRARRQKHEGQIQRTEDRMVGTQTLGCAGIRRAAGRRPGRRTRGSAGTNSLGTWSPVHRNAAGHPAALHVQVAFRSELNCRRG